MADTGGHPAGTDNPVPNPLRADLIALKHEVVAKETQIATALDQAARDMGGGGVWEGPAAQQFAAEAAGRRGEAQQLAREAVAVVEAALSSTPAQVPLSRAQAFRKAI
ncbi:hypothetical protein [Streptomyces sp. 3N207]|uniref:hypothetical protein n=1 Tax=Streptomyces sp. 3N207 TaxID=3457417 RepID=UPI003FD030F1